MGIVASDVLCSGPDCRGYIWMVERPSLAKEVFISQARESVFTAE